jgi:hypothetical protein
MKKTAHAVELHNAIVNYKRARTRHENEQTKGQRDISVKQTKRMYHAVGTMQRAYHRLKDANRAYARLEFGMTEREASMELLTTFDYLTELDNRI